MSRIKGFLRRGLLHIISFLGFVLSLLLAPIIILMGPIRELIFTISLKNELWEKDFPNLVKGSIFFFYLQIAIGVPGLTVQYLGIEHLLDGIVAAGIIIVFVALQFPRMLPPYFGAVLTATDQENKTFSISVKPGANVLLHFRITNLGLTLFKNCFISTTFEEGFTVVDSPKYQVTIDNRSAQFLPDKNYSTVAPCNHITFSIRVQTPTKVGEYKVRVVLISESTWGSAEQPLRMRVIANK